MEKKGSALERKEMLNSSCLAAKSDAGSVAVRARSPTDISGAGISLLEVWFLFCVCVKEPGSLCWMRSSKCSRGDTKLFSLFKSQAQLRPLCVCVCVSASELFNCPAG